MNTLVVASNNKNKIKEIEEILVGYNVISMEEIGIKMEIGEYGTTFEENSMIKAKSLYDIIKRPIIADDSGLCIDALNGAPGIYSARFFGSLNQTQKNRIILKKLEGEENRAAKFVCVMTYYNGEDDNFTVRGEVNGHILKTLSGAKGFGYDPIFFCDEINASFGMASKEQKNMVSHRARALRALCEKMEQRNGQ